jgi:transposase InsO family protein
MESAVRCNALGGGGTRAPWGYKTAVGHSASRSHTKLYTKEQLLWIRTFETVENLRIALQEFRNKYNREWLISRNGYLTPEQARLKLSLRPVAAA